MGIRGLNKIIDRYSPECISIKDINQYTGSKMAIDTSIFLYKYLSTIKDENAHIIGIINRIFYYVKNEIKPIFVFDGPPPIEKNKIIQKRTELKKKIFLKIEKLKTQIEEKKNNKESELYISELEDELKKMSKTTTCVNKYHVLECKKLLEGLGIPYIQATGEGEKMCAYLQMSGIVDFVVTDDTDALVFGENMIKSDIKNSKLVEINRKTLLDNLGFTHNEFMDMCILAGCDYLQSFKKIGPFTAYNIIKKYKNIERATRESKYNIVIQDYDKIRKLFIDFSEEKNIDIINIYENYLVVNRDSLDELFNSVNLNKKIIKKIYNFFL